MIGPLWLRYYYYSFTRVAIPEIFQHGTGRLKLWYIHQDYDILGKKKIHDFLSACFKFAGAMHRIFKYKHRKKNRKKESPEFLKKL